MNKRKNNYLEIYNEINDNQIVQEDVDAIISQLELICSLVPLDKFDIAEVMDVLFLLKKHNQLQKVNEESLQLLAKILGNDERKFDNDDVLYFHSYLRYLLVPSNYNHCEKEYNLCQFLAEFDIFVNLILENISENDLVLLKKYNNELYEIIIRYKAIIEKYRGNGSLDNVGITNAMIIDNTLTHLATILYFYSSEFQYKYDLLTSLFEKIINDLPGYLYQCYTYGIYQDRFGMIFNPENVLNEYVLCKKLLEDEINPPIKIYRKKGEF